MNGIHDMGGMHGFGPVDAMDDAIFHADWEKTIFALNAAIGELGLWNIDQSRSMMENLPPAEYLSKTYFERWVVRLERAAIAHGLVTREEVETGRALQRPRGGLTARKAAEVPDILACGSPSVRPETAPARFQQGEIVRAKQINPISHTRLPRYARGKVGRIELLHGVHVFPDSRVRGSGEDPQWLYAVRFEARTLWGNEADSCASIVLDVWEPNLEPVRD